MLEKFLKDEIKDKHELNNARGEKINEMGLKLKCAQTRRKPVSAEAPACSPSKTPLGMQLKNPAPPSASTASTAYCQIIAARRALAEAVPGEEL